MGKEELPVIGIWKLISIQTRADDGTLTYPLGRDVDGLAIIDARGYFSAQLMDMKRPSFKSGDARGGTPEEVRTAFESYIGYYGTFDIDVTKRVIIFHVRGAWLPNWIQSNQIRYYTLNGNGMTIKTAPVLYGGKKVVGELVWERVS